MIQRETGPEPETRPRLLLLDDEESILNALKRVFHKEGYELIATTRCAEAVERAARGDIAVVVSDQRMPEMLGAEVLGRIREHAPDTLRILLTGHSDASATVLAINRGGIHQYIAKPWDDDQLRLTVRNAVQQFQMKRENDRLKEILRRENEELSQLLSELETEKESAVRRQGLQHKLLSIIVSNPYVKKNVRFGGKTLEQLIGAINHAATASPDAATPPAPAPETRTAAARDAAAPASPAVRAERILSDEDIENRFRRIKEIKALPFIAAEILNLTADDTTSAKSLVSIISRDQSITAKVLQMANSSFYSTKSRVLNLEQAVVNIGFSGIRQMAVGIAILEQFKDGGEGMSRLRLWTHSLACGVIARAIARSVGHANAEDAFLAGLLHDLGKIFYDEYFHPQYTRALAEGKARGIPWNEAEETLLGYNHSQFARKILDHWKLPDVIRDVVVFHHHPIEKIANHKSKDSVMIGIVAVADSLAKLMGYSTGELDTLEALDDRLLAFVGIRSAGQMGDLLQGVRKEINDLAMVLLVHSAPQGAFVKYEEVDPHDTRKKNALLAGSSRFLLDPFEILLKDGFFVSKVALPELCDRMDDCDLAVVHVDSDAAARELPQCLARIRLEKNLNIPVLLWIEKEQAALLDSYNNALHPKLAAPLFLSGIRDILDSFQLALHP